MGQAELADDRYALKCTVLRVGIQRGRKSVAGLRHGGRGAAALGGAAAARLHPAGGGEGSGPPLHGGSHHGGRSVQQRWEGVFNPVILQPSAVRSPPPSSCTCLTWRDMWTATPGWTWTTSASGQTGWRRATAPPSPTSSRTTAASFSLPQTSGARTPPPSSWTPPLWIPCSVSSAAGKVITNKFI